MDEQGKVVTAEPDMPVQQADAYLLLPHPSFPLIPSFYRPNFPLDFCGAGFSEGWESKKAGGGKDKTPVKPRCRELFVASDWSITLRHSVP
jgi:hypothetical protein